MNLYWHRRDLRVTDNRGLAHAARGDDVVPVFVLDGEVLDRIGDRQRAFLLEGVRSLRRDYRERGSDLVVREGDSAAVLCELAGEYGVDRVYYADHYRPERRDRQRRVDANLATERVTDLVLVGPDRLADSYGTHSQFHDDWTAAPKPAPADEPDADSLADVTDGRTVPEATADVDLPEAGYAAARRRYDRFLADGIDSYAETRDDLAAAVESPVGAVSRLSPYLAAGMIGPREVWADATDRYHNAGEDARNVEKYRYELSWREFYYHLLYYNQSLPEESYVDFRREIAWENDPEQLAAWKHGETGYPLVDAGMRQLDSEGYVHNRPRQVVASFLTKHLLVDWRKGRRYFAEKLVDHDPASNAGNWQWAASTGTDSVAVRIFDPVAQTAKYDPDATYVKAYVPELVDVPADRVVEWPTLPAEERERLAPDYPDPVVDRDAAYERAQRVFERALGIR